MRKIIIFMLSICLITSMAAFSFADNAKNNKKDKAVRLEENEKTLSNEQDTSESQEEAHTPSSKIPDWVNKIYFYAMTSADFRWLDKGNPGDKSSTSRSDIYIRAFALNIESVPAEHVSTSLVLMSEFIGDSLEGGTGMIGVDEAIIDANIPNSQFYIKGGKTTLPFGLFESPFLTDPLTLEAFRIKKVGITIGYRNRFSPSFTLYKGEVIPGNLKESGLLDISLAKRMPSGSNTMSSYIANLMVSAIPKTLTVFGAFSSEPGYETRNTTMNLGFHFVLPSLPKLIFDAEYMQALQRETRMGMDRSFEEGALSMTAYYSFVVKEREPIGGATFRGQKTHIESNPILIAFRYEYFFDDGWAEELKSWSVKDRMTIGGRMTFNEESHLQLYTGAELRLTNYRLFGMSSDNRAENTAEIYLRLGINF